MSDNTKIVLSVGQCGFDNSRITSLFSSIGAFVRAADGESDALNFLGTQAPALILINRIFDADGAEGLDFLARLKKDPKTASIPMMLISNYQDAQSRAVELGALPGFGKAELADSGLAARLKAHLG